MDLVLLFDRSSSVPVYQQLAEELRQAVLSGRLKPNQKIPSTRLLAKSLGLSRATITQCYEQLLSEGYLESHHGSGTYVCAQLPEDSVEPEPVEPAASQGLELTSLSRFGHYLMRLDQMDVPEPEASISFRFDSPAADMFPMNLWRRLLSRHTRTPSMFLNYADAAGYFPLRVAISNYLRRSRAVRCTPEQIIIVNGSQQALDLIARLILEPGDWVAIEDPSYLGARHCFKGQRANLQAISVDAEGIKVSELDQYSQPFKLLYTTPSHQFPTGVLLPLARRLALLQWAQQNRTLIIEDDYDSEFRYGERPIPSLQGLDHNDTVIYIGTFSKILFPSLRIGYLVVPPAWESMLSRAKWLCDRQTPLLEQYALTDCFAEGHFDRHIRRMRHLYNQRRKTLVESLEHAFNDEVTILGENAGLHLMARFKTALSDDMIIRKANMLDVGLISAQSYYLKTPKSSEFIFGYGQLNTHQIEQGVSRLAQVLHEG